MSPWAMLFTSHLDRPFLAPGDKRSVGDFSVLKLVTGRQGLGFQKSLYAIQANGPRGQFPRSYQLLSHRIRKEPQVYAGSSQEPAASPELFTERQSLSRPLVLLEATSCGTVDLNGLRGLSH
jgi:hypothetical protein